MITGEENNQAAEQQQDQTIPAAESQVPASENQPAPENQDPPQQPSVPELDDAKVLDWLKAKNPEATFASVDDIFKAPEKVVEKVEVNPWEELADEEDKQYFTYKKETGRSRKDFEALNQDLSSISLLDMARDRVSKEIGRAVTKAEADAYLEDHLNVDLENPDEMTAAHLMKIEMFQRGHRVEKEAEKEKYRQPITPAPQQAQGFDKENFVQVGDGLFVDKTVVQKNQELDRIHNEQAKAALNSVGADSFKTEFDNNGVKTPITVDYDFKSDADLHRMGSRVGKYNEILDQRYRSDKGFDHVQFQKDFEWADPAFREKVIPMLVEKGIAQFLDVLSKSDNNVNFTRNQMPTNQNQQQTGPIYRANGGGGQSFAKINP